MHHEFTDKLYKLLVKQGQRIILDKGEVFQTSDSNLQISLVQKGYIKRYLIRNDGSLGVQAIYGPGQFFPLTIAYQLLLDYRVYTGPETFHYEAMTKSVIYSLDSDAFKQAVEKDPSLYKDLFFVSGRRTHSNIQRLENLSLLVYYNRVAHQLLYFAEMFGKEEGTKIVIELPLTQQDIADVLSSTRETVSLCITELKKKKIIEAAPGKKIAILKIGQLAKEAYS